MPVRSIPLERHRTVVSVLRAAAQVNGDVEAYVEPAGPGGPRRSLTFAQWDREADGVAGRLAELGVIKGDVVALCLPSSIDYALLYAALLRLGAITSGINPRMGQAEVDSILQRTSPVLVVREDTAGGPVPGGGRIVALADLVAARLDDAPVRWPHLSGSPRCGLDQRDHRHPQGRPLRPRQPGRGGTGDRRAEPARRPAALTPPVRPRGAT